jgi:predicted amidohydrolase
MNNIVAACVQPRLGIYESGAEFEAEAGRFLRQARAKGARITVFPEFSGLMLAPPLISGLKLGFVKREDQAKRPGAGLLSRGVGSVSAVAAGALGGGFRGSLDRLLRKKSDEFFDLYCQTFGGLAREFGTAIVAGSLYLYDSETGTVRNRAYVFDVDGAMLGYQDKLNLAPDEQELASPGSDLSVIETRFGRLGLLIGWDLLYPELARLLAMQGADLLVSVAASTGVAQANTLRSALAVRVEENQVFGAASFLLGPNYLGWDKREEFFGQSALLAPISLSARGDGILVQAGSNRTEGIIAAELDAEKMEELRETSRFRPRREMNLGNVGPVLSEAYRAGLTIEQAIEQQIGGPAAAEPEAPAEPTEEPPEAEPTEEPPEVEPSSVEPSVPEALSLTGHNEPEA